MDYILDDNTNHNKRREETLVKRRDIFRKLNLLLPLLNTIVFTFMSIEPDADRLIMGFFSNFLGMFLSGGLLGWLIGSVLSWIIWKDIHAGIRKKYLISISTLVYHSLLSAFLILIVLMFVLGWIKL